MTSRLRRFALGVGAVLTAVGLAAAVFAAPQGPPPPGPRPFGGRGAGGPGRGMGGGGPLGPLGIALPRLGLTAAQRDQIKTIVEAHRADMRDYAQSASEAREALAKAQMALAPDGTIRDLHAKLAAVEADIAVARAHILAEVLPVLTPEQQQMLRAADERARQRRSRPRADRR